MTREEKNIEKNKKIFLVCKVFLENDDYSILDVSKITGISTSSVQRYLTSDEVKQLITPQVSLYIKNRLKKSKLDAAIKGGNNSKKNNIFVKDSSGKFMGSVKNIV